MIEKHPPKYKLITYVKDKDKQKAVSLKVGKKITIPGTNYAATAKDFIADAEVLHEPINVSDEPKILLCIFSFQRKVVLLRKVGFLPKTVTGIMIPNVI